MKTRFTRLGALLMAGAVFAACSDSGADAPLAPEFARQSVEAPAVVEIEVCKVYTNVEAQGTYTFAHSGSQSGAGEVDLIAGDGTGTPILAGCDDTGAEVSFFVERGQTFTVTELAVGAGLATLESVSLLPYEGEPGEPGVCILNEDQATILSTGTASITIAEDRCFNTRYQIAFKNSALDDPPETGFNGCTPGYWRQEHHYGNWLNRSPGDDFDTTFGVNWFDPDMILGDAVQAKGGGINALARHAVAALLNAEQGFYPLTVAEVIAAVQGVDITDSDAVETLKNQFDRDNNLGCELGRAEDGEGDVTGNGNGNGNGNGKGKGKNG